MSRFGHDLHESLQDQLDEMTRQRDLLAQAIADAAHKAGIIHADALCDGPTLLMVLDDLAGCVTRVAAERDQFKAANGTLSAINEQRRNRLGDAKKAAGIGPDDDLVAAIEALRDKAELRQAVEHAAEHLPERWYIQLTVERGGSGVELFDDTPNEFEFASNHETMAESVRDAVEAAQEATRPDPDPGQPPAPSNWKAIAPPITAEERLCHDPDCWCCDGTGRDPADSTPCKWNNRLPF